MRFHRWIQRLTANDDKTKDHHTTSQVESIAQHIPAPIMANKANNLTNIIFGIVNAKQCNPCKIVLCTAGFVEMRGEIRRWLKLPSCFAMIGIAYLYNFPSYAYFLMQNLTLSANQNKSTASSRFCIVIVLCDATLSFPHRWSINRDYVW